MKRILLINLAMILLVTPVYAASADSPLYTALQDLNRSFINAHSAARELDLATGPVILHRNGQLVLINNDTKVTANVILPAYHTFKAFAHIPVAIYLMLSPQGSGMLDFERFQLFARCSNPTTLLLEVCLLSHLKIVFLFLLRDYHQ